jgi:DnaJ-class molecular chaperone
MEATEAEMLSLGRYAEESLVKQAQRRLSLTYHPDKFSELDIFLQQLMTRRMQEVNASADKLRGKK